MDQKSKCNLPQEWTWNAYSRITVNSQNIWMLRVRWLSNLHLTHAYISKIHFVFSPMFTRMCRILSNPMNQHFKGNQLINCSLTVSDSHITSSAAKVLRSKIPKMLNGRKSKGIPRISKFKNYSRYVSHDSKIDWIYHLRRLPYRIICEIL